MINASEIIGKKVISLFESELVGTISNFFLNKKRSKIAIYEILNKNDEKQYFSTNEIFSVGDVIVLKSMQNLISVDEFDFNSVTPSLINKQIFSEKGNYFGTVRDLVLKSLKEPDYLIVINSSSNLENEFNNITQPNLENIINPNNKNHNSSDTLISSIGLNSFIRFGEILILQEGETKIKFSSFKPKINLNQSFSSQKVYTLNNLENQINNKNILKPSAHNNSNFDLTGINSEEKTSLNYKQSEHILKEDFTENKISHLNKIAPVSVLSNNYKFLIGRKVDKNIIANNRELIIKKHSKITEKHIETANSYNKLRDLIIFSK